MKKRLLVLSLLVGLMLVVSSSVFGASDTISYTIGAGIGGYADIQGQYTNRVVNVVITITNNSDKWAVSSTNSFTLNNTLGSLGQNGSINGLSVDNFNGCEVLTSMSNYLSVNPVMTIKLDHGFILSPYEVRVISFDIKYQVIGSFNVGYNANITNKPTVNFKTIDQMTEYTRSEMSLLDKIQSTLQKILNNQSNSSTEQALDTASQQVTTQESIIHQQEMQWYQNNENAINDIGLENFNFSSGTLSGFSVMQQHFANIWNAIGDLNLIYTFTLMISLATFMIRHWPKTKQTETLTETETSSIDLISGKRSHRITSTRSRRIK